MSDAVVFDNGNSKIEWVKYIEAWHSDDPGDEELLRFNVSWLDPIYKEWNDAQDGSHCTQFRASATPTQRCKALEWMAHQLEGVREDGNFKRTCERLSWIDLATICEEALG